MFTHLVLAAGVGSRFSNTSSKLLHPFPSAENGCLVRLISQLHESFPKDSILLAVTTSTVVPQELLICSYLNIVCLDLQVGDNNSITVYKSLLLSSFDFQTSLVIWESDVYIDSYAFHLFSQFLLSLSSPKWSVLLTSIGVNPLILEGGFISSKTKCPYIGAREDSGDFKLFGVTVISHDYLSSYFSLLSQIVNSSSKFYFHQPFLGQSDICFEVYDFSEDKAFSFNTESQLSAGLNRLNVSKTRLTLKYIDPFKLIPLELTDSSRVKSLTDKIYNDQVWTTPLIVDTNSLVVMDGNHRHQVSMFLKLTSVPCFLASYSLIKYWPLHSHLKLESFNDFMSDPTLLPFPYKSIKHSFDHIDLNFNPLPLSRLYS